MTRKQMLWAQQHDWFISARQTLTLETEQQEPIASNWEVLAASASSCADGSTVRQIFITDSFVQLAAWAGY